MVVCRRPTKGMLAKSPAAAANPPLPPAFIRMLRGVSKMFQKRRVSSAPAETMVDPSGEISMLRTRAVCPVSSLILVMVGYFQRIN